MKRKITPRNEERCLAEDDFVVSRTDPKGRITYCNRIFMHLAGYREAELLNVQHNILRHPDMPRGAFKLIWDTLKEGQEVFAYIKNLASNGAYYWVFANITPDRDEAGNITGYYSVRRSPRRAAIEVIEPIYRQMLEIEKQHHARDQMDHSRAFLNDLLKEKGVSYEEFILAI